MVPHQTAIIHAAIVKLKMNSHALQAVRQETLLSMVTLPSPKLLPSPSQADHRKLLHAREKKFKVV